MGLLTTIDDFQTISPVRPRRHRRTGGFHRVQDVSVDTQSISAGFVFGEALGDDAGHTTLFPIPTALNNDARQGLQIPRLERRELIQANSKHIAQRVLSFRLQISTNDKVLSVRRRREPKGVSYCVWVFASPVLIAPQGR